MTDRATSGGPKLAVTGHVPGNASNDCALDASFGIGIADGS
jgi:hypothetical protein